MAQFTFVVQNSLSLLVLVKGIRVFLFHFVHDAKSMWCLERVTEATESHEASESRLFVCCYDIIDRWVTASSLLSWFSHWGDDMTGFDKQQSPREWLTNVATKIRRSSFQSENNFAIAATCVTRGNRLIADDWRVTWKCKLFQFLLCQVKCHMSVIPTIEADTAAGVFICKTDFDVYLFSRRFRFGNNHNLVLGEGVLIRYYL